MWVAYLVAIGYGMDEAVWINIDETPIPYHFGSKSGLKKLGTEEQQKQMIDRSSLKDIRSHCTLMGAIATNERVHQNLPQVLMPNMRGRKRDWDSAKSIAKKYPNVKVMDDTGGWVTTDVMAKYFEMLEETLKHLGVKKKVLVMDCHSTHRSIKTIKLLRKLK